MERVESNLFRANKVKLEMDGHGCCFICGTTKNIETHHMMCPYAKKESIAYDQLKLVCERFDIYGYAAEMKDLPITSVDDIRNLINVCEGHHKRHDHGIHNIPFADWLMQKIRKEQEREDRKNVD